MIYGNLLSTLVVIAIIAILTAITLVFLLRGMSKKAHVTSTEQDNGSPKTRLPRGLLRLQLKKLLKSVGAGWERLRKDEPLIHQLTTTLIHSTLVWVFVIAYIQVTSWMKILLHPWTV